MRWFHEGDNKQISVTWLAIQVVKAIDAIAISIRHTNAQLNNNTVIQLESIFLLSRPQEPTEPNSRYHKS